MGNGSDSVRNIFASLMALFPVIPDTFRTGRILSMHHRRDLMPDIKFYPDNLTITVADGTLLIEAIRQAGLYIDAPCGGQ